MFIYCEPCKMQMYSHVAQSQSLASGNAEHVAEANQKVQDARAAAEQAQQLLSKAEARAESAEEAKIELSIKLAELAAQHQSGGDVSGMPSKKASEAQLDGDSLQKRYAAAFAILFLHLHTQCPAVWRKRLDCRA